MRIHDPNITGSAISLNGFTGSLQGTASWAYSASQAISASFSFSSSLAVSSSFAVTASYATNAGSTLLFTSSILSSSVDTVFNINHGFNTRNLHITVYESSSNGVLGNGETVYPDIRRINENTASIVFAGAPRVPYIVYISQ